MNNFWRVTAICILSLVLLACSGGSSPESDADASSKIVSASSEYPFMGVAELDAYVKENAGKPTMALFWTTWCPSCKQEIPEMEKLNQTYSDKVNVITISLDEKVEALHQFFNGKDLDLPVYMGDEAIARKFGVEAIPTLVIFDKNGQQIFGKAGIFPHAMLEKMVDKMAGQ